MECTREIKCKDCEYRYARNKCMLGLAKGKSQLKDSICWICAKSAAPVGKRCIWDASRGTTLVDGATYDIKHIRHKDSGQGGYERDYFVIKSCPEFEMLERYRYRSDIDD